MAQLSDDCFAFNGPLMPVEDAARMMHEQVPTIVETETIDLAAANGRVLAEDITAVISLPSFANAAVDGYAVRHADIAATGETRLRVTSRIMAGAAAIKPVGAGEAARIFTGAPMPEGADTIYMQEDCRAEGDHVIVPTGLKAGANFRLPGEDIRAGEIAISAGRRLRPADIALAAAIGHSTLNVRRRIRVALFSTGDEIIEPGQPLRAAALYDSNRYHLLALLQRMGAQVSDLGILRDDPASLRKAITEAAATHDLVLTSGGVSTGEADHVRQTVEAIGKLVFWRLAIKPGRPVAMAVVNGKPFVGLPGNPVAVFVTFLHIVRPLLLRLSGAALEPLTPVYALADFSYRKKKGRLEYVRVSLAGESTAMARVRKYPTEGAGLITSLTRTTGLVELSEDVTEVAPGDVVSYLPYETLID